MLFIQNIVNGFIDGATIALMALALVIVFKTAFANNFSLSTISVFAGYVTTTIVTSVIKSGGDASVWLIIGAMLLAIVINFFIGFFIDAVLIRNARKIDASGRQMITMGLILVFRALIDIIFDPTNYMFAPKFTNTAFGGQGKISVDAQSLINVIISLTVLTLVFMALRFTKWGLGVRATASNEKVASMMSVNTKMITGLSWAIGAAISGLAAIAFLQAKQPQLNPTNLNTMMIYAFLALILGGTQTFHGPVIAAFLFSITLNGVYTLTPKWGEVITFSLVMLVVLIKPVGLFGERVAKKV
ncbi:MAG: branched-chain amino acid ABC transporter permease [Acholeplasmataceae bacterium]